MCCMLNLFDHIFKQGSVLLVITGIETTEQDKNNKIGPLKINIIENHKFKLGRLGTNLACYLRSKFCYFWMVITSIKIN